MSDVRRSAIVAFLGLVLLLPCGAWAQELGTVAGVVKDSSDSVLPGVTVEVSSPALIEKVRVAVTDGSGQYRISNLPPGVYRVTFTLPGFTTQARDSIDVRVNFTTSINGVLTVGQQSETITVVGESPIVDVQTVTQSRAITADQNKELPSGGGIFDLAKFVPGVTANFADVGGSSAESAGTRVSIRGGSNGDTVPLLDGLKVGNLFVGAGQVNIMPINPLLADQFDVQTSGQGADNASLGVTTNIIPRSGGNVFSGTAYVNGGRGKWQGNNLTDRVKALGLTAFNPVRGLSDVNGGFGGPLKRDRIWFYSIARYNKYSNFIAGQYFTKDISATKRELDTTRQAYNETNNREGAIRVTGQLTQAQRLTGLFYYQSRLYPYQGVSAVNAPEAATNYDFPGYFYSGSYTNVLTNRLLLDGAMLYSYSPFTWTPDAEIMRRSAGLSATQIINGVNGAVVPILEQGGTLTPPYNYRSSTTIQYKGDTLLTRLPYRGSLSYTTGSHSLKFGFDNSQGVRRNDTTYDNIGNIAYRTLNFVPNQITLYAPPVTNTQVLDVDMGIYAQERWTLNRTTVTAGLRADFLRASTTSFTNGPTSWIPQRGSRPTDTYQGKENVPNWKDINPRLGLVYDLFGNGKTALKGSMARGVAIEALGTAIANDPATTVAASTTRTWADVNQNFIPDCDLTNPAAQGPATTGSIDSCGANQNGAFGSSIPATASNPEILNGWHKRPWIWEFSAGVQHEIIPRVSMSGTWFKRVEGNFTLTDNLATTAADYRRYQVNVPVDSRIPDSGTTIAGFADVRPELLGVTRNYITFASDYGHMYRQYNGFDLTVDARPRPSLYVQGGVSTGQTSRDSCEILEKVPEAAFPLGGGGGGGGQNVDGLIDQPFCKQATGFRAQYKFLGAYTLPVWDIRLSGTFQSIPGVQILANTIYTGAQIVAQNPSLGAFSTGPNGQATLNVIEPGTVFNDRTNQFDMRFAKIVSLGGTHKVDLSLDLYNMFNVDAIQGQNNTYSGVNGGAWLRPTALIPPRFMKMTARWDF